MAEFPLKTTYAEPTIMWRVRNARDRRRGYSVVVPHGAQATAGWFSQGILQESHDFPTWHDALRWLDNKLMTLQMHGWHEDQSPNQRS